VWKYVGKKAWLSTSIMSFFSLSIEDIAECSRNFISTWPRFKSSGLRSATVAYCINENDVLVKQTSDPKVNSFPVSQLMLLYCASLKLILQVTPFC
jgi:hypothetical protein